MMVKSPDIVEWKQRFPSLLRIASGLGVSVFMGQARIVLLFPLILRSDPALAIDMVQGLDEVIHWGNIIHSILERNKAEIKIDPLKWQSETSVQP